MEDQYTIVRLTPDHYEELISLYERCFGVRLKLADIRAKYNTSRFGARDLGYLARSADGSPAAYYGVFCTKVIENGTIIMAAQSGDTMTDPGHQRRGLFMRLAKATYELAKSQGVAFVFGFPNNNSLPGFRDKLGWTFSDHLYDFRLVTRAPPLCELASRYSLLHVPYQLYLQLVKGSMKASCAPELALKAAHQLRDATFFDYKVLNGGFWARTGRLRAFVHPHVHLYVGDMEFPASYGAEDLKRDLLRLGRRFLARQVVVTLSGKHPHTELMKQVVQPVQSLPVGYLPLNTGEPTDGMVFTRMDLDTF